jgi:hypothetical protein
VRVVERQVEVPVDIGLPQPVRPQHRHAVAKPRWCQLIA